MEWPGQRVRAFEAEFGRGESSRGSVSVGRRRGPPSRRALPRRTAVRAQSRPRGMPWSSCSKARVRTPGPGGRQAPRRVCRRRPRSKSGAAASGARAADTRGDRGRRSSDPTPAHEARAARPNSLRPPERRRPAHAGPLAGRGGSHGVAKRTVSRPASRARQPSRSFTPSRSSRSSLCVALMRARLKSSIARPWTISYLPPLQTTG